MVDNDGAKAAASRQATTSRSTAAAAEIAEWLNPREVIVNSSNDTYDKLPFPIERLNNMSLKEREYVIEAGRWCLVLERC